MYIRLIMVIYENLTATHSYGKGEVELRQGRAKVDVCIRQQWTNHDGVKKGVGTLGHAGYL